MKPPRELFSLMEALELIHVTTYPFHLMWICKSNPVGLPPFCYKLQHTGNCRGRKTTWVSPSTLLRQCLLFTMLCRGGGLGASGDFLASTTLVAEECWGVRVLGIWTQLPKFVWQILYPFTEPHLQPAIQDLTPNLPACKSSAISSGFVSPGSLHVGVPESS